MENKNVGISYGIIADSLSKQLTQQGLKFDKKKMDIFEEQREALNKLRFGCGLLTDSMASKLTLKLHNKVMAHVAKANNREVIKPKTKNA